MAQANAERDEALERANQDLITKVAEAPKTTPKGWHTVVDGDGTTDFIYVQKYGATKRGSPSARHSGR